MGMAASRLDVAPVKPERIRPVAEAIARGFYDNEAWAWVLQSDRRRLGQLTRYYEAMIRHIFIPRGEAWATPDAQGGILWLPPLQHRLSVRDELRELIALLPAGLGALRRGSRTGETMKRHHPSEPHVYLNTLSIDPGHQRMGYGGALMAPMLERCDEQGLPCYLETQRESNVPYYRQFGFELREHIHVDGGGPPMWLMWRIPRNGG
jgi:GNAT superfamily N-acetyltransferase